MDDKENVEQGKQWIAKAANENLPEAQWVLGSMMADDDQTRVRAAILVRLAKEGGEPKARLLHEQLTSRLTDEELRQESPVS